MNQFMQKLHSLHFELDRFFKLGFQIIVLIIQNYLLILKKTLPSSEKSA